MSRQKFNIDKKGRVTDLLDDDDLVCSYCGREYDHDDEALNCCANNK